MVTQFSKAQAPLTAVYSELSLYPSQWQLHDSQAVYVPVTYTERGPKKVI